MSLVRRILGSIFLASLTAVCANATITPVAPSVDGDGCYLIGSAAELYGFSAITNGTMTAVEGAATPYCVKLTNDITVNTGVLNADMSVNATDSSTFEKWIPISYFSGTFDGQGHVVSGLYFNGYTDDVGLFGFLQENVEIKNLGIEDSYFYGRSCVGAFVGSKSGPGNLKFSNCYSRSYVKAGNQYTGGFVGYGYRGSVEVNNSYVAGGIGASNYAGVIMYGSNYNASSVSVSNLFYLSTLKGAAKGTSKTAEEFANGNVVSRLFSGTDGTIWRQGESDAYPSFSGNEVKGVDVCYLHYSDEKIDLMKCEGVLPNKVSRVGYLFDGWFVSRNYSGEKLMEIPEGTDPETSYYAKWTKLAEPQVVEGCYQISSAVDLYSFAAIVNGNFAESRDAEPAACGKLAANITLNGDIFENGWLSANSDKFVQWTPIGTETHPFKGTFDGDYHTISGLYFNGMDKSAVGLFGFVTGDNTVRIANVGIDGAYLNADHSVGGLVGVAENAKLNIENVYTKGIFTGNSSVGGVVGYTSWNGNVVISNSYAVGSVMGSYSFGGLFGEALAAAHAVNSYFLESMKGYNEVEFGHAVASELFENGTVATLLHNGENGSRWGQNTNAMTGSLYPDFSGSVVSSLVPLMVTLHYGESDERTLEYFDGFRSLSSAEREGKMFLGWYTNSEYSGSRITEIPSDATSETVIYAKWSEPVDGCIQIASVEDLYDFAILVNGFDGTSPRPALCGKLTSNITVNSNVIVDDTLNPDYSDFKVWIPIGTENAPFMGSFDGQGYTISGLYFNDMSKDNVGLFGNVVVAKGETLRIKNLGVEDSYFRAGRNIGGIVGRVVPSNDENINAVEITRVHSKGVFGTFEGDCMNYSQCPEHVGGLVGFIHSLNVDLSESYSEVTVKGSEYVGGLVGYVENQVTLNVQNSYSRGSMKARSYAGGLVGQISRPNKLIVTNCYSAVDLYVTEGHVGALIGYDTTYNRVEMAIKNFFYENRYEGQMSTLRVGDSATAEHFTSGIIAGLLHHYTVNGNNVGAVWGQKDEDGSYPDLSGNLEKVAPYRTVVLHSLGEATPYIFYESFSKKIPMDTLEGYLFQGWYADESYSGEAFTEFPDDVEDVYAKWIKITKPELVNGCYEIASAGDLYGFAAIVNGTVAFNGDVLETNERHEKVCGKLLNDIVVNEHVLNAKGDINKNSSAFAPWTPIGTGELFVNELTNRYDYASFQGTFDGQGHTISGLYFNDAERDSIGLFGRVSGESVVIENVGLVDSYMQGRYYVGALIGCVDSGINLQLNGVYNKARVYGYGNTAGVIGYVKESSIVISNSYNAGTISADGTFIGGLIGYIKYSDVTMKNVYNVGDISAADEVGGIIGGMYNQSSNTLTIYNSYSAGQIRTSTSDAYPAEGAFVGTYSETPFYAENNYYLSGLTCSKGGSSASISEFASGVVARDLHDFNMNGVDGSIWGQNITDGNVFPDFSGEIVGTATPLYVTLHSFFGSQSYEYYTGYRTIPTSLEFEARVFMGWFADEKYSGEALTEIPEGATDLYAKWFEFKKPKLVDGCYEINSAEELYGFAAVVNGTSVINENAIELNSAETGACGKLNKDIVLNQNVLKPNGELSDDSLSFVSWVPMGSSSKPFVGSFDGNGHTISGLYCNNPSQNAVGLFGYVGGYGVNVSIREVGMVDSYFMGGSEVGGILGYLANDASLILEQVYNASTVVSRYGSAGGLVGEVSYSDLRMSNVYNTGLVRGSRVGGISGSVYGSQASIINAYNAGKIDGSYCFGNIIGYDYDSSPVISNAFGLGRMCGEYETCVTEEQFFDGSVATFLHKGENGSVWGQRVGEDAYPNFSANVVGGPTIKSVVLHDGDNVYEYEYLNSFAQLPNLSSEELLFAGWYLNSDFSGKPIAEIPADATEKMPIYAKVIKVKKPQFADGCYEIGSVGELYGFAAIVNGTSYYDGDFVVKNSPVSNVCGKLTADITVNENVLNANGSLSKNTAGFIQWTPIGGNDYNNGYRPFAGDFDGQGHTISGLYLNDVSRSYVGFFGFVTGNGASSTIRKVGLVDSYFKAGYSVGGFVGELDGVDQLTLEHVYNTAFVGGTDYVGGIVGESYYSNVSIVSSYNAGKIEGGSSLECLIGSSYGGSVNVSNTYYLEGQGGEYGTSASVSDFADGTVASLLHNYSDNGVDGSIWGQNLAVDAYPTFSGSVTYELVLDWDKANDTRSIPQNLPSGAVVRIADGKQFFVNGEIYEGELSSEQIAAIGTSTMYPISGVTFEQGANGLKATIDAKSDVSLVIPMDVAVGEVVLDRSFKADTYSSIVLPFSIARSSVSGGAVYEFTGIKKNDSGKWVFAVRTVQDDKMLQANHPYVVMPDATGKLVFGAPVTLNSVENAGPQISGSWQFVGAYEYKQWLEGDSEIGYAYGIAGEDNASKGIKAGDFVKVAAGASIAPTRSYLIYRKTSSSRPAAPGEVFGGIGVNPDVLEIEIVDENGEQPLVIGTFNIRTGEIRTADDRWFDMKGRILNAKPTQKGTYFHKGKQVIIK